MAYALYRGKNGGSIRAISGNPRNRSNQRGLVVWAPKKTEVKSWIRRWGTNTQKSKHL